MKSSGIFVCYVIFNNSYIMSFILKIIVDKNEIIFFIFYCFTLQIFYIVSLRE